VGASIKTVATKGDITSVISEMRDANADTIKWMFIFWVGQVGAMIGVAMLFLKK